MYDDHRDGDRPGGTGGAAGTAGTYRAVRRAVLDHVLALIARAPWSEQLVLRGSAAMLAWAGAAARPPGDLDFVVLPLLGTPVDRLDPYPYLDRIGRVQQWPEAADGAAGYEIWTDGEAEYETRGLRAAVPPEGLGWEAGPDEDEPDPRDPGPPYGDLLDLLGRWPEAAPGVLLAADRAREEGNWTYAGEDGGLPGVRLRIPWQGPGLPPGELQLDFAQDERFPEPPVLTAVPRGDGGAPAVVRTASRALSLAWKLRWLHTDATVGDRPQAKDLYDAVLLAEDGRTALSPRLLRTVLGPTPARAPGGFRPQDLRVREADWAAFRADHPGVRGPAEQWLARLGTALARGPAGPPAPAGG
ncbi:nucleotidyl transferase AbiEii/AbiGii toxin family protein [Kitasatospora indigofera]|uniref:nucleotidyl transferase AbiEii/AbiGii toxin family protein n=1 Tax=Kitasatospora indigofera TaxID=67307 RepID=UPI003684E28F